MRTTTNNDGTAYTIDENNAFTLFFMKERPPELTLTHYFTPNSTDEVGGMRTLVIKISDWKSGAKKGFRIYVELPIGYRFEGYCKNVLFGYDEDDQKKRLHRDEYSCEHLLTGENLNFGYILVDRTIPEGLDDFDVEFEINLINPGYMVPMKALTVIIRDDRTHLAFY